MSTGARGGGRGRGRGQGRGRGRGGAKTAASKDFVTTTVENNDSSLTTDAPQQKQQQKKNDVTMTEKKKNNNNNNNNNNNKPGKKANNKPAAAPAPAAPAAPAPAKANNDKNNQKNRKRGRKEAENGDVPVVEANATASVNEDKPVEPPAKRQKTENGGYRKKFKRDENWTPGNEHIKGQTPLISVYNIPTDATVEEIEELVEEQVGVRPIKVRVIPRMSKQKKPSAAQSQSGKVHVMFETPEQAVTAVEKLNGFTYKDNELKAQYTKEVKLTLNEDYRGISTALKLYEAYGSTVEDIISAIKKYCTNVPDNLRVRRLYTGGYDYGIVSIETGDVDIAQRMEKELKGKSIKDHVPLVGYWAQPWKKNQKPGKEQEQEQEQMQVDNE